MTLAHDLIKKYESAWDSLSEKEKAQAEKEVWDATDHIVRHSYQRREYLAAFLSGTQAKVQVREALLNAGSAVDILWERIHAGKMLPTTAHSLLRRAKGRVELHKETLVEGLAFVLMDHDSLPIAHTSDGREFRRRNPSSLRRPPAKGERPAKKKGGSDDSKLIFGQIRGMVAAYCAARMEGLDPIVSERIMQSVSKDLNAVLVEFAGRVYRAAQQEKQEIKLMVEIGRREIIEACRVLRMDPPRAGTPVNMSLAKRQKRILARLFHPDANDGSNSFTEQYDEVVKAYEMIESYNQKISGEVGGDPVAS